MFFLVYVSSAVDLFSDKELVDLLDVSRRNNEKLGITGLLLYKDGNFMQFLEGARENVLATMEKVERDRRHRGVIRLMEKEEAKREFSDWSMGFQKLSEVDLTDVPGYSDFMSRSLTSETFTKNPSNSLRLLLTFRTAMR